MSTYVVRAPASAELHPRKYDEGDGMVTLAWNVSEEDSRKYTQPGVEVIERSLADWRFAYNDGGRFWYVYNENDDGQVLVSGIERERAAYAVMLLRAGAFDLTQPRFDLGHEVDYAIEKVTCAVCEKHFMRAQLHELTCPGCQS